MLTWCIRRMAWSHKYTSRSRSNQKSIEIVSRQLRLRPRSRLYHFVANSMKLKHVLLSRPTVNNSTLSRLGSASCCAFLNISGQHGTGGFHSRCSVDFDNIIHPSRSRTAVTPVQSWPRLFHSGDRLLSNSNHEESKDHEDGEMVHKPVLLLKEDKSQTESQRETVTPSTHTENETYHRNVGRTTESQENLCILPPDSPPNSRLLRVAVIGAPNAGKSTLTNALMGWRVSSVSNKVHTTRRNTLAVFTQDEVQFVFLDTPGILQLGTRKKHKLDLTMELDPIKSLAAADLVCAVVDVKGIDGVQNLNMRLMEVLYLNRHIPSILVLNKIDLLRDKSSLLQTIRILSDRDVRKREKKQNREARLFRAADRKLGLARQEKVVLDNDTLFPPDPDLPSVPETLGDYLKATQKARRLLEGRRGWPLFQEVFSISATQGQGLDQLKNYLMWSARPAPWDYHSSVVTDQDTREIILLCVRENLLECLRNEVPYQLGLELVLLEEDPEDHLLNVVVNVYCWSDRHLTIFLGRDGDMIRSVSSKTKQAIMDTFRCDVRLKLVALRRTKPKGRSRRR